jgi:hypothetical protein
LVLRCVARAPNTTEVYGMLTNSHTGCGMDSQCQFRSFIPHPFSSPTEVPAATWLGWLRRFEEGWGNSDEDIEEAWTWKTEIE